VLEIGQTISHYTILETIGHGGMGVVYKARDTRLNRLVAIKTLPAERMADQERIRRFEQEAISASALNHPNIITIYEIDSTGQVAFIAMEYIKGRSLNEVIPANGLDTGQALKYAVQIADALAALHREGIVHRDLKPANIMVGENASVKVLDFGLAKLTEKEKATEKSDLRTAGQTEDGVMLGTLPYMSPEQVEGKPVDMRSDIFSFGVMLHEMISGRRPFQGEDKFSLAVAILHENPVSLTQIKSSVPLDIERTVSRCLEKDPQKRFQHAADLKFALEWLSRDIDSGKLRAIEPPAPPRRRKRHMPVLLALLSAIIAIAAAALYWFRSPPQFTPDLKRITSDIGLAACPALSPDGSLLAYASDRSGAGNLDIWVQQIANGQLLPRTFGPTDDISPNFSPDGSSIVFTKTGSGVFVVPALAGDEKQIAPRGLDPRFSPDGTRIVYWVGDVDNPAPSGKVYIIALGGGEPTQIGAEFADARYPLWAPDGKHILFQGVHSPAEEPEWWVVPIAQGSAICTGVLSQLRKQNLLPVPGPGDWKKNCLVFSAREKESRHIYGVTIKPPGFHLDGAVRRLTAGTGIEADPSIASNGQVAVAGWYVRNNLWRLSLQSAESHPGSLDQLSNTGAFDTHPSVAAGANKMAFLSRRSGTRQAFIRDLATGKESELTIGTGEKSAPVIAPDGSLVAYSVIESGKPSIYVVPTDNSRPGGAKRVCENCGVPSDWIPDLSGILYVAGVPQCVFRLNLASGISTPILRNQALNLDQPHISPDGRWIAFVAAISPDRSRIFLCSLGTAAISPDRWVAITDGNSWDDKPRWLDNDSLIYYSNRDQFGCIWKLQLKPGTNQTDGIPVAVHHFHELRRSPRILYRSDFEIAVARDFVVLNMAELSGNIWLTSIPPDLQSEGR
jgi:serine/threonine protein kinase